MTPLRVAALTDLGSWDGCQPVVVVPTPALVERRDRLLWGLGRGEPGIPVTLAAPLASAPVGLPALFAWLFDAVRWQRLGLLRATLAVSSDLPRCLGAPLGLPVHVLPVTRGAGAPLPCNACPASGTSCEGVPAGVVAAAADREALRRDLAALLRTGPLEGLDGAWVQHDLGLRRAVRAIDDGATWAGVPTGLASATVDVPLVDAPGGHLRPEPASRRRIVYAGRDAGAVAALADLEGRLLANEVGPDEVHARLGEAFGYPSCCVQAFTTDNHAYEGVDEPGWGVNPVHVDRIADRSAAFDPLLNPFLRAPRALRLIEHLPCRFDCAASRDLARATAREVLRRAPVLAPVLPDLLGVVALVLPDRDEVLFRGRLVTPRRATILRVVQPGALAGDALFAADTLEVHDDRRVVLRLGERVLDEVAVVSSSLAPGLPRLLPFGGRPSA